MKDSTKNYQRSENTPDPSPHSIRKTFTLLIQFFVGSILLIKGMDTMMTLFPQESYTGPGKDLMAVMAQTPLLAFMISALHSLLGALLIFNVFVPFTLLLAAPLLAFGFAFEVLYGTNMIPQILTLMSVLATISLFVYHKGFFWKFLKFQMYSDVNSFESSSPDVILLDELKEKSPARFKEIMAIKEVKQASL